MSSIHAVELNNVTKRYNEIVAVNNINLTIKHRRNLRPAWPQRLRKINHPKNANGLATTHRRLSQSSGLRRTKRPRRQLKRQVGYVPESPDVYEFLTGIEYLDFIGDIYGIPAAEKQQRITEYLKALQLEGREGDMINSYSDGMKKKISLISAFLHKPKLLILDEPLNALDPRSARIVKDYLQSLKAQGVTTILSTHVLEIAEAVCDRIGIMYQGNILALGNMSELRERCQACQVQV